MGRENKIITTVFTNIVRLKGGRPSAYNEFLILDEELSIPVSDELKSIKDRYMSILMKINEDLRELANLEEIIVQLRSLELIDTDIKIFLQREYIYARSTFLRIDKETKDIRAIIGKTDIYGDDLVKLENDPVFMEKAKNAIRGVMKSEIEKNLNKCLQPA